MKNRIGWCTMTFNPVWGCRNHCEYCYARAIAKRFGAIRFIEEWHYRTEHYMDAVRFKLQNSLDLIDFKPTFLYSQIGKKLPKKPQRIFVGSMSEIYYWEKFWIEGVIKKIKLYPQHIFQFLTKHPAVYERYIFPRNCWLGVTITRDIELNDVSFLQFAYRDSNNIKYISFEPLLNRMVFLSVLNYFDWVIIGAETGNRKGKVIPNLDWVLEIAGYCKHHKIPVYIKDNLTKYYAECRGYKEFPEKLKK